MSIYVYIYMFKSLSTSLSTLRLQESMMSHGYMHCCLQLGSTQVWQLWSTPASWTHLAWKENHKCVWLCIGWCDGGFNSKGRPIVNTVEECLEMLAKLPDLDYVSWVGTICRWLVSWASTHCRLSWGWQFIKFHLSNMFGRPMWSGV